MNTKTILNIKTDKKLKEDAQKTAEMLGVPLSTIMNAFLKQFTREKEITFSLDAHKASAYLENLAKEAREEFLSGNSSGSFTSAKEMIKSLKA